MPIDKFFFLFDHGVVPAAAATAAPPGPAAPLALLHDPERVRLALSPLRRRLLARRRGGGSGGGHHAMVE